MSDGKYIFNSSGVYLLRYAVERLEWAIVTVNNPTQLASFFDEFRLYEDVMSFEDIGREAESYHDMLSNRAILYWL